MTDREGSSLTEFRRKGRRVVLFSARPNPGHRTLVEIGTGGECVAGWLMALAYSGVTWKTRFYNYAWAPWSAPVEALRFCRRYDVFLVPAHALPLGYWIKKWRPDARIIYFNHCPFLVGVEQKPWYFRRYVKMMLGAVDGVHSLSRLSDRYAAEALSVPRAITHLFAGEEFDGVCRDPTAEDLIIVSALHATKGILEGIAAFQVFRDRLGRPVTLTIIGDGPMRKEAERIASADGGIRLLGHQPRSIVAAQLARSSVLLMLSRFDTFAAAVIEAARVGVLPLMSDTVGSSELFPMELVVPVGDREAAAGRLLWLYQLSRPDQEALRERVRAVSAEFTRERQCARFRDAIADLVARIDRAAQKRQGGSPSMAFDR